MTEGVLEEISRLLEQTDDADDALRRVVARIANEPGVAWAGIAFVEDGTLTLGPSAGTPDETRRTRVPIGFLGDSVGELVVDGSTVTLALARVAELIAPYVLIGWDTAGEAWQA
jgi:putative methionine-R-sulfoxide reductase with GAF domain